MPALSGIEPGRSVKVAASAPFELMWLFHNLQASHELLGPWASQEPWRLALGDEMSAFWDDDLRGYTEVIVLAHRTGTLLDLDLTRYFTTLEQGMTEAAAPATLLSETRLERETIYHRLARLRAEPDLRLRYADLLRRIWDLARPEWSHPGRAACVAEGERWKRRLAEGATYLDILDRPRVWAGRNEFDELAAGADERGTLVISPGWFYGKVHVVEIDGTVYIGKAVRDGDVEPAYRDLAASVSSRIKALADPTRLSILMMLAHKQASVTEIARQFKLSQPTVSGHIQILREAGLLEEKASGRSAVLSASEEGLRRLFASAQDSLLGLFRD